MAGLESRYLVTKINDPEGKHENCRYFVLDPKHDEFALKALEEYANRCSYAYPELADDLESWIKEIRDLQSTHQE